MKNKIVLDFCIWGFEDMIPDEITQILGVEPVRIYTKGEKVNPKLNTLVKENGWRMNSSMGEYSSFEDQMNAILDIIEQKLELFQPLCKKYYCEFSCALFISNANKESSPSIHLSSRYNNINRVLNAEFDIDIYYQAK